MAIMRRECGEGARAFDVESNHFGNTRPNFYYLCAIPESFRTSSSKHQFVICNLQPEHKVHVQQLPVRRKIILVKPSWTNSPSASKS